MMRKRRTLRLNYNEIVFYRAGMYALVQHWKETTENDMGNTEKCLNAVATYDVVSMTVSCTLHGVGGGIIF
jgi:hypothetical protein